MDIGQHERAITVLQTSVNLGEANGLGTTDGHIEALTRLASAHGIRRQSAEAQRARNEALRILGARGDTNSLLLARVLANAPVSSGSNVELESQRLKQAITLFETKYPTHPDYFTAVRLMGQLLHNEARTAEAQSYFRRADALFEPTGSNDYTNRAILLIRMGVDECDLAKPNVGLVIIEKGLALLERHQGANSFLLRIHKVMYAKHLHAAGRYTEAETLFTHLRTTASQRTAINDYEISVFEADALMDRGRYREALERLAAFASRSDELGKMAHPVSHLNWTLYALSSNAKLGNVAEAEKIRAKLDSRLDSTGSDGKKSADYLLAISSLAVAQNRPDLALETLNALLVNSTSEPNSFSSTYVVVNIQAAEIELIAARSGRATKSLNESALRHANAALRHLTARTEAGARPYLQARAQKALGDALLANGQNVEAERALQEATQIMRGLHDPASPMLADAANSLVSAERANAQTR